MSEVRGLGLAVAFLFATGLVAAAPAAAADLELSLDRKRVVTSIGDSFSFNSTITNLGSRPLPEPVAHLNVVGLDKDIYVDPEDWSEQRTKFLAPLRPGASTTVPWTVQAVTGGKAAIYVTALPGRSPATESGGLGVSAAIEVRISERRNINSGGVLPLAIGVPAALGILMLGLRSRRKR
jgi:hypothetical protein